MMVTGYEVRMYADISRIANALERIAKALEAQALVAQHPDPGSLPKLPQTAFNLETSEPGPADNVQAGPQDPDLS